MYEKSEAEFDLDFRRYREENFKRYLDDCFLIFTKTEEQLQKFHNLLNNLHPSIKFTKEKSKTPLPFLIFSLLTKTENFTHTFTTNLQILNNTSFTHHATRNILEIAYHII